MPLSSMYCFIDATERSIPYERNGIIMPDSPDLTLSNASVKSASKKEAKSAERAVRFSPITFAASVDVPAVLNIEPKIEVNFLAWNSVKPKVVRALSAKPFTESSKSSNTVCTTFCISTNSELASFKPNNVLKEILTPAIPNSLDFSLPRASVTLFTSLTPPRSPITSVIFKVP